MRLRLFSVALWACAVILVSSVALPLLAAAPAAPAPTGTPLAVVAPLHLSAGSSSSLNWAGYAVTGAAGSVSDVKGSWNVPAIQGSCPSTNQYSSFWVGIDGFNSNTVEQTGTDSDCRSGTPTYYAWYEFYPHPSKVISGLSVHPGDVISAEVLFSGNAFTVSIQDQTTGGTFSTSAHVKSAQRSSAEWIAEAPSSSGGILPLSDFGTVSFGADTTGVSSTCTATIGGVSGAIAAFGSNVQSISMVTSSGALKASPSSLSTDGTSFSVTWKSSGP